MDRPRHRRRHCTNFAGHGWTRHSKQFQQRQWQVVLLSPVLLPYGVVRDLSQLCTQPHARCCPHFRWFRHADRHLMGNNFDHAASRASMSAATCGQPPSAASCCVARPAAILRGASPTWSSSTRRKGVLSRSNSPKPQPSHVCLCSLPACATSVLRSSAKGADAGAILRGGRHRSRPRPRPRPRPQPHLRRRPRRMHHHHPPPPTTTRRRHPFRLLAAALARADALATELATADRAVFVAAAAILERILSSPIASCRVLWSVRAP